MVSYILSGVNQIVSGFYIPESVKTLGRNIHLFCIEFFATFTSVLPNCVKWYYHVHVTGEIIPHPVKYRVPNGKTYTAILYLHGKIQPGSRAVLHAHGDLSFPATMLNLAKIAQKQNVGSVFSLGISYNDNKSEIHRALLKKGMEKIKTLLNVGVVQLTGCGHSKGAIEFAYYSFCDQDNQVPGIKIEKLISVAGRLRVMNPNSNECHPVLTKMLAPIYPAVQANTDIPLYQIFGDKDWNAPRGAMEIRPGPETSFPIPNESHLSVVYARATQDRYASLLAS